MHPYRAPYVPEAKRCIAVHRDGTRLAFGVMAGSGAVEALIGLGHGLVPSAASLFGASCFVVGSAWLLRHRHD